MSHQHLGADKLIENTKRKRRQHGEHDIEERKAPLFDQNLTGKAIVKRKLAQIIR